MIRKTKSSRQSKKAPFTSQKRRSAIPAQRSDSLQHTPLETRNLLAAANPLGEQFLVNETFSLESDAPAIAITSASGNFVSAWTSFEEGADFLGFGVYVQRFDAGGNALSAKELVNAAGIEGDQIAPAIASDGAGNFLLAWQSKDQVTGDNNIHARWYDATSGTFGSAFMVNTTTVGDQAAPSVAMDHDGNAVVAWQSAEQDGSGFGIVAKQFTKFSTVASEFLVNHQIDGDQTSPDVAMVGSGSFVVTWEGFSTVEVEGSVEIFARTFAADGSAQQANDVLVNSLTLRDQVTPQVAVDNGGNFAVTWVSEGIPGSGSDIFARRFDSAALPLSAEFKVNPTISASQVNPDIGMNGSGNFLVTWQSVHLDGYSWGIYGSEYDSTGNVIPGKEEFRINNRVNGPQTNAAISTRPDGKTVITWVGNDTDHKPAVHAKGYSLPGMTQPGEVADWVLSNFIALEDTPPAAFMNGAGQTTIVWESYGEDGDSLGIFARRLDSVGDPLAAAFQVNTSALGNQSNPSIAGNLAGQFIVVWQGDNSSAPGHEVFGQLFDVDGNPVGGEFQINQTILDDQSHPVAAMAEDGSFVVVWQSPDVEGFGIWGRRYAADGTPLGNEFQVNQETARDQVAPAIAMNAAGQFVVAWVSDHPAASDPLNDPEKSVFVQWFDADGSFNGPEVIAHVYAKDAQEHPGVGIDAAGNFVVTWQSINQEPGTQTGKSWGVFARRFAADKSPLTPEEFLVNETIGGPQRYSNVGVDAAGNFSIAWQSNSHDQEGSSWDVYLRQYDAAGTALRGEELVNNWDTGPQINPIIARAATGNFGVFWSGQGFNHAEGIHGRLYDVNLPDTISFPTRLPIGPQFLVAETFALESSPPDFGIDANGNFVVTWESFEEDGSGWGVYARRFDAAGNAVSGVFQVNTFTTGDQHAPAIGMDGEGNFLIVWQSNGQDGDGYGIYGQWYNSFGNAIGGEFQINTDSVGQQSLPDVSLVTAAGSTVAVVTWQGGDAEAEGIRAKIFSSLGDTSGSSEFQVNTNADGSQTRPAVSMSSDGSQFVIVWQGPAPVLEGEEASIEVYGQRFASNGLGGYAANGGEFTVNSLLEHDQTSPTVAMNNSGAFVVSYVTEGQMSSGSDVFARRFDSSGNPQGGEFMVNTVTARPQRVPTVGMDDAGNFFVAWQSQFQEPDPFSWGIFGRQYDANGTPLSDELLLNQLTAGPQTNAAIAVNGAGQAVGGWVGLDAAHHPAIHGRIGQLLNPVLSPEMVLANYSAPEEAPPAAGMDANGNSLVVWQSYLEDGSGLGVFAQRLDLYGNPLGSKFQVNTLTLGNQEQPAVAVAPDGRAVIVWQGRTSESEGWGIFARMLDSSGNFVGDEFRINTVLTGDHTQPDVAIAPDGYFVVAWQAPDGDLTGIYARRFQPDGTPADSDDHHINSFGTLAQFGPSVAINANHQIAFAWVSDHPAATDPLDTEKSIFVQWVDANFNSNSAEVIANTFVKDAQELPDIGIDANGNFTVVWQSINQDGNTWGVFVRQFLADKTPIQNREFAVNTTRTGPQRYATVGVAPDGRFVVAWESNSPDNEGSSWDLFIQQFSANAVREGGELALNTFVEGPQIHPVVAQAPNGEFGVYWVGRGTDKSEGVHGRIYRFPDYGDLPDSFGTTLTSNLEGGARHAWTGPFLGTLRDREVDGAPSVSADGDNLNGQNDEDGVFFTSPILPGFQTNLQIVASGPGILNAWLDFNGNSLWDADEQIFTNVALVSGLNQLSFLVPATATAGLGSYARFRFSTQADLGPVGTAIDGEIEDYAVQLASTVVTNTLDNGSGSLRQAILVANATPGMQTITFAIPGAGWHSIQPLTALPEITDVLVIDGESQPGFAGMPLIELNGLLAGSGVSGLTLKAATTVKGLAINQFAAHGILIMNSGGSYILNNLIGTDITGALDRGNGGSGIFVSNGFNNQIRHNVLSGNGANGLTLRGSATTVNQVFENRVGTDISGLMAVGNSGSGVSLLGGAANNVIGNTTPGNGNQISGNWRTGVTLRDAATTGNRIQGNLIGTDANGTGDLGNLSYGVNIDNAVGNSIHQNVISGNNSVGVAISGASSSGNTLTGNRIGVDVHATSALANGWHGVMLLNGAHDNVIGGRSAATRNILSGNQHSGVEIRGETTTGNRVIGNYIGTDETGMVAVANGVHGVVMQFGAQGNWIGGTAVGSGNLISGNSLDGVYVSSPTTQGNTISGNNIGLDVTQSVKLGNQIYGVDINESQNNRILGNTISGNLESGVAIRGSTATNNSLQRNLIGTNAAGIDLGNGKSGVWIDQGAHHNRIGGVDPNTGNTIAWNGMHGVAVGSSSSVGNAILQNSIRDNVFLGIDLGLDGITTNDSGDADLGSNQFQNFPVLTLAMLESSGNLQLSYFVDSLPANAGYPLRIEFFLADSSNLEGAVFLGADYFLEADFLAGGKTISLSPLTAVASGKRIVATATDLNGLGNTSEFSASQIVI